MSIWIMVSMKFDVNSWCWQKFSDLCFKRELGFSFDRFEFIKMGKQGKRVLKENINLTLDKRKIIETRDKILQWLERGQKKNVDF